jgi:hypothetical protein
MNLQTDSVKATAGKQGYQAAARESTRTIRTPALLCLLALVAGLLTGCAHVKRYSIESWDGPLPLADLHHVNPDL